MREGFDLTLVCYGTRVNDALDACDLLQAQGVSAELIKLGVLKPNAFPETLRSLEKTGRLLIAEDVCAAGCVGERLLAAAAARGRRRKASRLINVGDGIVPQGSVPELLREYGLDGEGIARAARSLLRGDEP